MRVEDRHNLHTPYPQIITDKIDVDLIANLKTELAGRILRVAILPLFLSRLKSTISFHSVGTDKIGSGVVVEPLQVYLL